MTSYELTVEAEQDIRELVQYTFQKWGSSQVNNYTSYLEATFEKIGKGNVIAKKFSDILPEVLVTKSKYHFVFFVSPKNKKPVIIAIIHEKRNILKLLINRLT
ncbi:MAG: type II toxin-antitoxin system RelE/ParE family toxin [Glaciecola sp.]|jgi:toxin ParE1/3/4|nr:type II toxin-antitoxin system RelE/ParE family toxin [Glaciecola sp.]MDG1816974.1 type II toxin-antitoxin system RelE/ParE family toxin [Glaciecola sp.]MDG2099721.1 type II toxin-antitoxin system RelE/ParE family toxin [Glaciecola sp.]